MGKKLKLKHFSFRRNFLVCLITLTASCAQIMRHSQLILSTWDIVWKWKFDRWTLFIYWSVVTETILWELSLTLFTGFHKSHNPYSQVVTMIQMSWLEKAECVCRDWTVSSARCVSESTVVSTAKHLQSVNQSFPVFQFLILKRNMGNETSKWKSNGCKIHKPGW